MRPMDTPVLNIVVSAEHEPPLLLGTLMPSMPDDDAAIVRYFDSSPDEAEHFALEDCVRIVRIDLS